MRFAILSSLALLPVLAQAQAAPAGTQTLASVSQPKLVRVGATSATTAAPAGIAVAPVSFRDVIHTRLNADLRDQRTAGEVSHTFYGDSLDNDARVQVPQLIHTVGRTLPVAQVETAEKTDVAVHVLVNAAGIPMFPSISQSAGQPIDKATLAAVSQYRFAPARLDGVPVESDLTLTIHLEKN